MDSPIETASSAENPRPYSRNPVLRLAVHSGRAGV